MSESDWIDGSNIIERYGMIDNLHCVMMYEQFALAGLFLI